MYWLLYAQINTVFCLVEYNFSLGSLDILLLFILVSVLFFHIMNLLFCWCLPFLFVFVSTVHQSAMKSLLLFLYYLYTWNKRINALPTISGSILVMCAVRIV